jgi:predicted metal-dependent peptidase
MTDDETLVHRVLNAVPARSYAMNALLSLVRVEASREVETAAVSCERRPVLRINPDFVRARCRTDEHLFLLVMHELHHVLLGHTRMFPCATWAHNLAFDAVINSLLVLQHPERAYTSFFLEIYGAEKGVARLLAPPDGRPIAEPASPAL